MKSENTFGMRGGFLAACLVGSLTFACGGDDSGDNSGGSDGATLTAMPAGVGAVKGKVMAAEYKKPGKIPASSTDAVCQKHFPDGSIILEGKEMNEDKTLPHTFVYVSKVGDKAADKTWKFDVPTTAVKITQKGCRYLPHVVGVMKGQKLSVSSEDATQHNVHWMGTKNRFFKGNWIQFKDQVDTDTLKKTEHSFFQCEVHGWMKCQVHVMAHTLFTVTDAKGNFTLPKLPAGEYEITAMHEKHGTAKRKVTVGTGDVTVDIPFK